MHLPFAESTCSANRAGIPYSHQVPQRRGDSEIVGRLLSLCRDRSSPACCASQMSIKPLRANRVEIAMGNRVLTRFAVAGMTALAMNIDGVSAKAQSSADQPIGTANCTTYNIPGLPHGVKVGISDLGSPPNDGIKMMWRVESNDTFIGYPVVYGEPRIGAPEFVIQGLSLANPKVQYNSSLRDWYLKHREVGFFAQAGDRMGAAFGFVPGNSRIEPIEGRGATYIVAAARKWHRQCATPELSKADIEALIQYREAHRVHTCVGFALIMNCN